MHGRQRSVGNGYRSGSIGMGMSASRISPARRPMRGRGFYGSEHLHRGFNRGFVRGRGRSKSFLNQLPLSIQPPRSAGHIFMDAGLLAADYLVSQGVLPQTVLEVSPSAADKTRYVDGYSSAGSRNTLKERRSHHFVTSGTWSEKSKAFDDSVSGNREEHPLAEDIASSVQRSVSADSESVLDKYNLQDEAQSKTGSSSAGKEIVQDCEISKVSQASSSLSAGSGEVKGSNVGDTENQNAIGDASINRHCVADESFTNSGIDLATLCKFGKVPTRTRSSLTAKAPKLYLSQNIKDTSRVLKQDETKNLCQSSGKAQSAGDETLHDQVEVLAPVQFVENSKCHRSVSFPNSILSDNSEKDSGLNLHRSHSVGKWAGEGSGLEERAKRQRDWVSLPASEANEHLNIIKRSESQCDLEEEDKTSFFNRSLVDSASGKIVSHESLANNYMGLHKRISGPGCAEEHQLFPASFKICDLNLGGASDMNDGKKEFGQAVDFDLSISSSSKSLEFSTSTRMSNGKEIEVIDLDNDDSPEVVKSCNNPGRKQDAAPYMGINDVPDYSEGLMMVEYLDSFGNIPTVNPESNAVQTVPQNNGGGLQDREGAPGNDQIPNNTDDDSIFMSLGEIPLTFLQAWDQPPARGYSKPF